MSFLKKYPNNSIDPTFVLRQISGITGRLPIDSENYFNLLVKKIDRKVLNVLPDRVILDMVDGLTLIENVKYGSSFRAQLFDYSIIIAPLFKALEGTMIFIAESLELEIDKPWQVGRALDEKKLKKYFDEVVDKLKDLDEDSKIEIKIWLSNCQTYLTHYRHNPAHYGNEIVPSYEKLKQKTETIFETINELTIRLINNGLIEK